MYNSQFCLKVIFRKEKLFFNKKKLFLSKNINVIIITPSSNYKFGQRVVNLYHLMNYPPYLSAGLHIVTIYNLNHF